MTIYIDSDYKCYTSEADGRRAVETNFFDGKCPEWIESFRFVPAGETWTRGDGQAFKGEMIAPCRDYSQISEIQSAVDRAQTQSQQTITEYEQALTEIEKALGVTSE